MDALARAAAEYPSSLALVTAERTITYAELNAAASGVADLVRSSGSLGTHAVALWGDRTPETVAAIWGIPRADVAAIPVDPRTPPALAMEMTQMAGVRGLWVPPSGGFDRLVERGSNVHHEGEGEYIIFTSGSEGRPKGVRLTRRNVEASVAASTDRLGHGHADAWLCILPLFHVSGLSILWRQAASAASVALHQRFDPPAVAAALGDVAFASFVPTMLEHVLAAGGVGHDALQAVLVGGAASDVTLLEAARRVGIPVVPTYGMTETCAQVATPPPSASLDGTVGSGLNGVELKVMREGTSVVGEEGRIMVRGPMVSPGYIGEEPRPPGSWHSTGDIGVLDHIGRLRVVGRADSVIISGGENVHPSAIESFLRSHGDIHAAKVWGVPDPSWGEVIAAAVETDLSASDLDAFVASLAPHMRPRRWEIVERLPENLV